MLLERIEPIWQGRLCVVAAPGHSLTAEQIERCAGVPLIAVNDAYRLAPMADTLYAADKQWWETRTGCPGFEGEKLSCYNLGHRSPDSEKERLAKRFGLKLIRGKREAGFSADPTLVHFGKNSGFQAVNIALLRDAWPVILIGFDMHGDHFFGRHELPLRDTRDYQAFIGNFETAAKQVAPGRILNATPGSALRCFPTVDLAEALDRESGKSGSQDHHSTLQRLAG